MSFTRRHRPTAVSGRQALRPIVMTEAGASASTVEARVRITVALPIRSRQTRHRSVPLTTNSHPARRIPCSAAAAPNHSRAGHDRQDHGPSGPGICRIASGRHQARPHAGEALAAKGCRCRVRRRYCKGRHAGLGGRFVLTTPSLVAFLDENPDDRERGYAVHPPRADNELSQQAYQDCAR